MKKVALSLVVSVLVLSGVSANAKNVWRDCGIGALIFPTVKWAAVVSNIIWDLGTTATTSNVSSDETCAASGTASTAKFIFENYANLEEQTASGSGEHLSAMLNGLGCNAQSHNMIINSVRGDLQKAVSTPDYTQKPQVEKAEMYYNSVIHSIQANHAQCALI